MSRPGNLKLFISYAWKDDQPFVERLYSDLRLGYDPWMDKEKMPSRGRPLAREVEEQLEACDRVIAVMGPEAMASEACRCRHRDKRYSKSSESSGSVTAPSAGTR